MHITVHNKMYRKNVGYKIKRYINRTNRAEIVRRRDVGIPPYKSFDFLLQ